MIKTFLSYTAIIEGITGITLIILPSKIIPVLLNADLTTSLEKVLALIAGAAIFSTALFTWMLRNHSGAGIAVKVMLFYNAAVAITLLYGVFDLGFNGTILWLVILFHSFQSVMSLFIMNKHPTSNNQ